MLRSVAAILHDWDPPDWLDKWSEGSPANRPQRPPPSEES